MPIKFTRSEPSPETDLFRFNEMEKRRMADVFLNLDIKTEALYFLIKDEGMEWEDYENLLRLVGNYRAFETISPPDKDMILEATLREIRNIMMKYVEILI